MNDSAKGLRNLPGVVRVREIHLTNHAFCRQFPDLWGFRKSRKLNNKQKNFGGISDRRQPKASESVVCNVPLGMEIVQCNTNVREEGRWRDEGENLTK